MAPFIYDHARAAMTSRGVVPTRRDVYEVVRLARIFIVEGASEIEALTWAVDLVVGAVHRHYLRRGSNGECGRVVHSRRASRT